MMIAGPHVAKHRFARNPMPCARGKQFFVSCYVEEYAFYLSTQAQGHVMSSLSAS